MAPDLASRLRWAATQARVLWPRPRLPTGAGSDAATCSTAPCGPRVLSIKKMLAYLPVQLGTLVPNARVHVFKSPHVRAIMCLQDVRSGSVVNTYKVCEHASTVRLQCDVSTIDHSSGTVAVPSDSTA
jgi:hypothetical protein